MLVLVGGLVRVGDVVRVGWVVLMGCAVNPLVGVACTFSVAVLVACTARVEVCCIVGVVPPGAAVLLAPVMGVPVPVAAATWAVRVLVPTAPGVLVATTPPVGVRLTSDGEMPGVRLPGVGPGVGPGAIGMVIPTGTSISGPSPISTLIADRLPYNCPISAFIGPGKAATSPPKLLNVCSNLVMVVLIPALTPAST